VTLGNWTRTLHARKEMRLVHFKDIGNKRYNVNDTAMREWVKPVQHVIDRVMSGDW